MATTRIKEKISELVNSQLPEFIRSDYTTFVAFLEYYYKFLEQDQGALELVQNARQYSDIDQTTESFVNYFLTNYAKDLPVSLLVDKPLLIKKIKGLYAAKGSTLSIETLFKVLYDTVAQTNHPYDFVLRPSDGQWSLRNSIRVLLTFGSAADIKDRFLTFSKNNINYTAEIVRVKSLSGNLYEIFYHSVFPVPFEVNEEVTVLGTSGTLFIGTIKPTTTNVTITTGGTGFRVGQIFNVTVGSGVDTLVRIAKVSPTGSIEKLRLLNYGYNFTEDISILLSNALGVTKRVKYLQTKGGGFSEAFAALKIHSITDADRYFLEEYVTPFNYTGTTLVSSTSTSQILTSVTSTGVENPSDASLTFILGAVARYPGEYISTQGFVSEPDVRVQDSKLYQPFAYQISSELDISTFYNIVKKLVHQAGTNLFVNRVLTATANLSANVSVITRQNVYADLFSTFSTLETVTKLIGKVPDTDSANVVESETFIMFKPIDPPDSITLTDNTPITTTKALSDDNIASTDNGTYFTINKTVVVWGPYSIIDPARYFDSDYVDPFDYTGTEPVEGGVLDGGTVYVTESLTDVFSKLIDNTDSIVSFTESGNGILLNYTDAVGLSGYFLEYYVGEEVITIS